MHRRQFCRSTAQAAALALLPLKLFPQAGKAAHGRFVLDMVHFNPGEPPPVTAFLDPHRLADWGYSGQVLYTHIEGVPTFDAVAPGVVPAAGPERPWAAAYAAHLDKQIAAAHDAGIKVYAWMQVAVFPRAVVARFRDLICDSKGRIDVERPKTQELLAAQFQEIMDRFPALDGFLIRTGEVYMHDLPYHASSGNTEGTELIQAGSAIIDGPASHIALLKLLREQVCVRRGRRIFYRTWDFGDNFHTNPAYYLQVTGQIEPHENLVFSIKHQAGDFHQLTPFNPTLTIGRHRQIVEVQCQREFYGKGAHPYYIGQGVIEGWEDMDWINPPGRAKGLQDIIHNPLIAGVWTWSRGGGWEGPYIKDEFWCAQNAWVISHYGEDPARDEPALFDSYSRYAGLLPKSSAPFRQLCLLSTKAVLRGQLTTLRAQIDNTWARDDKLSAPGLSDFIRLGLVDKSIAEKQQAVEMWRQIRALSLQVEFRSAATTAFVRSSCTYGLMKYSIIAAGWTALILGQAGKASGQYDKPRIAAAIAQYDDLWRQWKQIAASDPYSATLVRDVAFAGRPGMGAAIDSLRPLVAAPAQTSHHAYAIPGSTFGA
jgi:hypothetical protein